MRRSFVLALLVLLTGGCRLTTGTAGVLAVSVEASRTTIRVGEPVALTLVATNEGNAPVTVMLPYCAPPIEVRDARGILVGPGEGVICALINYAPSVLAPGERATLTSRWLGRTGPALQQVPVAPGTYRLRAANFIILSGGVLRLSDATVVVTE